MTLHPLEGHEGLRESLARAFSSSALPNVLLFHGPKGVGKQRLALWTGQLLLCEQAPSGRPCAECVGCRMSARLEHPDLLWYFPIKRPPSKGSRARDQEALEEARWAVIEQVRADPLQPSHSEGALGLHLGTVRNLKKEATRGPAIASRRVFVVAEAQELVSQEASPEAANALLKLLEEPPASCWFMLTSSEPGRLLPTVRSRTMDLHVPPLTVERVRGFLSRCREDLADTELEKAARLSGGSIGRALGYLPSDGEPGPLERIRQNAFHLLRAALSVRAADRFALSLSHSPAGARGLQELLSSLESWLRDLAAIASSSDAPLLNHDARAWLSKAARSARIEPARAARCIRHVEEARNLAAGNVNPQLILTRMLDDLHSGLVSADSFAPNEVS